MATNIIYALNNPSTCNVNVHAYLCCSGSNFHIKNMLFDRNNGMEMPLNFQLHKVSTQPKMEISFVITSKLMMFIHVPRLTYIYS